MEKLPTIKVKKQSGQEAFELNGLSLDMNVLSFWQWSSSDLIGNAMRGILAEYIVASSVGVTSGIRTEWDAFDIETPEGIKIEVKSSAYIQSWEQHKLSTIQFGIRPTQSWDYDANKRSDKIMRHADVYVFCLLKHKEQSSINPLNLDQWVFYVLPTHKLNQSVGAQKSITLNRLKALAPSKVGYSDLYASIKQAVV